MWGRVFSGKRRQVTTIRQLNEAVATEAFERPFPPCVCSRPFLKEFVKGKSSCTQVATCRLLLRPAEDPYTGQIAAYAQQY